MDSSSRVGSKGGRRRRAGAAVRWKIVEAVLGRAMVVGVLFVVTAGAAVVEWERVSAHAGGTEWVARVWTVVAGIAGVAAVVLVPRMFRRVQELKLEYRGKREVGRSLEEECGKLGYRVMHDVRGAGEVRMDHVVIGAGGVFVVETRKWERPEGFAGIRVEGEILVKADGGFDAQAVACVRGQVEYLRKWLAVGTGRAVGAIPVKGVLVLPGWFVEPLDREAGVWVVPNDMVHRWIGQEGERLGVEEVEAFCEVMGG